MLGALVLGEVDTLISFVVEVWFLRGGDGGF